MRPCSIHRHTTESKITRYLLLLTTLEGLASLFFMLNLPKSASNAWLLGYSPNRVALMLGLLLGDLALIWLTVNFWCKPTWERKWRALIDHLAARDHLSELALATLSAGFIIAVFFLIFWQFTTDTYYQAYLLRFGPVLIFGALVIVQLLALLLFSVCASTRIAWSWSLLFASVLILLQEWMLFTFYYRNTLALILAILLTSIFAQVLFRRSFLMPKKIQLSWIIAVISVGAFLCMELFFIPKFYRESSIFLIPMILLGLVGSTRLIDKLCSVISQNIWARVLMNLIIAAGFIYLGSLYYLAGNAHSEQVNTTFADRDEASYMGFAIKARDSNFRFTGTRNQMPVYPYIQGFFYDPNMNLVDFFAQGKQINIFLSLASLVVLFLAFNKILPLYQVINLTLITAFGLYVFKSGYFMTELLYYSLGALAYMLMSLSLVRPSIKLSVGTGIVLGIGHLTKASVLPALLLFIGIFLANEVFTIILGWKKKPLNTDRTQPGLKVRIGNLFLVVICYLAVISPYIIESKRIYGSYFYNVNSTFYMWYDSWEEAIEGTMAHGDGKAWPDMPSEDIPNPGNYFREHTLSDVWDRIEYGIYWQTENIRYQYGFFNYPVLLMIYAIVLFSIDLKRNLSIAKKYFPLVIFAACYFAAYLSLYIWYSPIANLPRFIYALYVPLLLSIFVAMKVLASEMNLPLIKLINLTVFGMILIDIWYIISQGPFTHDFGS